jgi:DNA helicase TIP49 (TBP-interacting protein)
MSPRSNAMPSHYKTMEQADVPQGRHGKHKEIVSTILRDLDNLKDGSAIKVPLAGLVESKEKVRSALNRATRKAGRNVATASDADFLYVWNVIEPR